MKGLSHKVLELRNLSTFRATTTLTEMQKVHKAPIIKAKIPASSSDGSFCKYSHRVCMQNCIEGYDYCLRHILEDKAAPFKQCTYMTKAGKRCPMAAPKQERKDGYCLEHAKKSFIARQRFARKRKPKETTESLLEELNLWYSGSSEAMSGEHRRGKTHTDSIASKALEYASSSDSEIERPLADQLWRDDEDSEAESIDSDQEDILKFAGIYTAEEVAQILRDKLIRLQALYIDQFKRLKHVLLSKRRQYLEARKVERETFGSIKLYKNDPHQRDKYDKLCAMKRYHKKFGKEALLQKQETEKRLQVTEGVTTPRLSSHFHKCAFVDEGLRCNSRVVPLSKFCQKHILHDPAQVLYRPCPFADNQCGRPVPVILNSQFCSLHQPVPPFQSMEHVAIEEDEKAQVVKLEMEDVKDPGQASLSHLRTTEAESEIIKSDQIKLEASSEADQLVRKEGEPHNLGVLFTLGEEEEEENDDGQAR
ncbi:KAT8 regulatory NSL complex subunit 2 [Bulinus truncatus]|nr:KAT8 regulatory NSL complex subunit 2 [Bulinus truncatus]